MSAEEFLHNNENAPEKIKNILAFQFCAMTNAIENNDLKDVPKFMFPFSKKHLLEFAEAYAKQYTKNLIEQLAPNNESQDEIIRDLEELLNKGI
jgi:hypothetical protein